MVAQKLKKGQEKRRQDLARQFFGECTDRDFMVAEKGRNGIVRIEETAVTKAYYGGAFRRPTFVVIRCANVYGVTYDQSAGAEEVTLHTGFGNVTWNIYGANVFVLQLLGGMVGDAGVALLAGALERTAKA